MLYSGATWGALIDSRVVLGASLDFGADPCGAEFGAANMSLALCCVLGLRVVFVTIGFEVDYRD